MKSGFFQNSLKFIGPLLVGILILVLGYLFDIGILNRELILLQQEISNKKNYLQEEYDRRKNNNFTVSDKPLDSLDGIEIFYELQKLLTRSQIEINLFDSKDVSQKAITHLEIRATYKEILDFIGFLLKRNFLTKIESLDLKKGDSVGSVLTLNLSLSFYRAGLSKDHLSNQLSMGGLDRDIFCWPSKQRGIVIWSTKELRFVGTINQGGETFGVVVDPEGVSYKLSVGDKVGVDQNKVLKIDQNKIEMEDKNIISF